MLLILAICLALPQQYVNLIMEKRFEEALEYCEGMIQKNKDPFLWKLEKGDIYYNKLLEFDKAAEVYQDVVENYKKDQGWAYYRLAQVLEVKEDFLNSAKMYEVVATRFRKFPLDSFALTGVERCFKKNYQDYVATVDGYNITRLELDERTSHASPFAPKDDKAVLEQMITERLIHTNAVAHGVKDTDFFKDNYKIASRRLLLDEIRAYEVMLKATPTEKEMKKYYKEHKEDYKLREQVTGKELVVDSDSLAIVLLDSLKKDISSFDTLAKMHSVEGTARNGGNMGVVYRGHKPESVEKVIFETEPNSLTDVITWDDKYGVYYVTSYKPERYREFDEVSSGIEAQVKTENIRKREEELAKKLRKEAKIKIHDDSIIAVLKDTTEQSNGIVLAEVNGRPITWGDVMQREEATAPQAPQAPQKSELDLTNPSRVEELVNTMIEEELRLELGWRKKHFLHDGYFVQVHGAFMRIMDQGLYKKVVLDMATVDSLEIEKFYEEHIEDFKIPESARLKEIVVDSRELAESIHREIIADPDAFDSLAIEYSTAATGKRGGNLGIIRKGMMQPEYDEVVFSLNTGEISRVFSVDGAKWQIVEMIEHNQERYRGLEEIRYSIESRLGNELRGKLANEFITKIKEEANIQIFLPEVEEKPEQETEGGDKQ